MPKIRVLVLFLLVLAAPFAARADSDLSFGSPIGQLTSGSMVTIPVEISGVSNLATAVFGITFDPNALELVSVSEGSFMPSAGATAFLGIIDNSIGQAGLADVLLNPGIGASGSGEIADLSFLLLGPGQSSLSFQNPLLLDSNGNVIPVTTNGAQIAVAPEPGTLALVTLSLGYLYLRRKKLGVR